MTTPDPVLTYRRTQRGLLLSRYASAIEVSPSEARALLVALAEVLDPKAGPEPFVFIMPSGEGCSSCGSTGPCNAACPADVRPRDGSEVADG